MKKILTITGLAVALAAPLLSFASYTYIDMSSVSSTQLFGYAGSLFTDLWVLIAIAIGVPLAFYIIKKVIGLLPKR